MKAMKLAGLRILKVLGVFSTVRAATRDRLRILCYHGAWRGDPGFGGDSMFIAPATFERRLALLREQGYPVIDLADALDRRARGEPLPACAVIITIDDGWYSTFADMLPALRRHGLPATLYCDSASVEASGPVPHVAARYLRAIHASDRRLSAAAETAYAEAVDLSLPRPERDAALAAFAAAIGADLPALCRDRVFDYMTPAELAEAHAAGLSVELHTHNHTLHDFSPAGIAEEIAANRAALGAILQRPPESFRHFCYPSGRTRPTAPAALAAAGVASATTLEPRLADPADDARMLPRILDGEQMTEIEFEAELAGVGELLRRGRGGVQRLRAAFGRRGESRVSAAAR